MLIQATESPDNESGISPVGLICRTCAPASPIAPDANRSGEPPPKPKQEAVIRRGSHSIEASMGFPPRDPNKFIGKIVWASPVTGCFRYQEHYVCSALSDYLKGSVLIIGDDLIGDPGLKERIDSNCHSLSRMCRADVVFRFRSWELDMSGQTMFIRTDMIHASNPR